MKAEIFLGTKNKKKLRELQHLLEACPFVLRTVDEFPPMPEPEEWGKSFRENAEKKAEYYAKKTGLYAISDDSGLEVEVLGGRPGILSSRFAGKDATDDANIHKLLQEMRGVSQEDRKGRFQCAIAFASPEKVCFSVVGSCSGFILERKRGTGGFGYDPLFFYPPLKRTFAQLSEEEKGRVSHRGRALKKFKEKIVRFARGKSLFDTRPLEKRVKGRP